MVIHIHVKKRNVNYSLTYHHLNDQLLMYRSCTLYLKEAETFTTLPFAFFTFRLTSTPTELNKKHTDIPIKNGIQYS